MASDVSICNQALLAVGGKFITTLDDNTNEAKTAKLYYVDTRDALFRSHPWNCLVDRATLALDATPPVFGYDNQYQLPGNCLRVLKLNEYSLVTLRNGFVLEDDNTNLWKIEGRKLLTNESSANIVFLKRLTDPGQWDALLIAALIANLAVHFAWPISKSAAMVKNRWEIFQDIMSNARSIDGMEGIPDSLQSNEIGGVR